MQWYLWVSERTVSDSHTVTIKADIPDRLLGEMQALDTHRPELMERFIRKDIEWGLGGND